MFSLIFRLSLPAPELLVRQQRNKSPTKHHSFQFCFNLTVYGSFWPQNCILNLQTFERNYHFLPKLFKNLLWAIIFGEKPLGKWIIKQAFVLLSINFTNG